MALEDDTIFGFSEPVARELDNLRGSLDREHREWHEVPNDGGSKFAARMMGAWSAKSVSSEIYTLDGVDVVYKETTTLYDPLSVFASLGTDDWLYCTFQGGKYYAADPASCPGTSPLIADPPETQP